MVRLLIVALLAVAAAPAAADPAAGRKIFDGQCGICHAVTPGTNRIGPSLAGIVGRVSGTEAKYAYSPAMKKAAITWSRATLDTYLVGPAKLVPGTKMAFAGIADATKRANLTDYLATLK